MYIQQDVDDLNAMNKGITARAVQEIINNTLSGDIIKQNIDKIQNERLDKMEENMLLMKQQYEWTLSKIINYASGLGFKIPAGSYSAYIANIVTTSGHKVKW